MLRDDLPDIPPDATEEDIRHIIEQERRRRWEIANGIDEPTPEEILRYGLEKGPIAARAKRKPTRFKPVPPDFRVKRPMPSIDELVASVDPNLPDRALWEFFHRHCNEASRPPALNLDLDRPKWALTSDERDALRAIKRVANREQWEQGGNQAQTIGFWEFRKAVRERRRQEAGESEGAGARPIGVSRGGDGRGVRSRARTGRR